MFVGFKDFSLLFWNTIFMTAPEMGWFRMILLKVFDKSLRCKRIVLKASFQFYRQRFSNLFFNAIIKMGNFVIFSCYISNEIRPGVIAFLIGSLSPLPIVPLFVTNPYLLVI